MNSIRNWRHSLDSVSEPYMLLVTSTEGELFAGVRKSFRVDG